MIEGILSFFQKPRFYKNAAVSKVEVISYQVPAIRYFNFFFILRYCLRSIGSWVPPVGLKNIFYRWGGIQLGKKVFIGESTYFIDGFNGDLIVLEDEAVLSPKTVLVAMAVPGQSFLQHRYRVVKVGRITVKKGAWLGAGCVVLPGVTIGEGSIVGANAVVTEDIPDYEVWGGNPARFIKRVSDYGEAGHGR